MPQKPRRGGGAGSSMLSDRISPRPSPSQSPGAGTTKNRQAVSSGDTTGKQAQKSPQVQRLENLITALQKSSGGITKHPKGGCFCLARDHPLSEYVRLCQACGLILCSANPPQFACPFCSSPLLSSQERSSLIADLEQQIVDTLAREAEERERVIEEAKKAAGAFPTLLDTIKHPQPRNAFTPQHSQQQPTSQDPRRNLPPLAQQSHKVMSLGKRGSNKVVISSYSPSSPSGSRPASRGPEASKSQEKEKDDVKRVPPPAKWPKHSTRKLDPNRPWENLLVEGNVAYIPWAGNAVD